MRKVKLIKAVCILCAACIIWTLPISIVYAAPQELEYMTDDYPILRVEPKGDGVVYDVDFVFLRGPESEPMAALSGRGVGVEQWPNDPARENYTFVGWFDNPERAGKPYSKDTPIYSNTELYAKWKYAGKGGCWPRPHRGGLQGIEEGGSFEPGEEISIIADGYNMHLSTPKDQRFRWIPVRWYISESEQGEFSKEAPYSAVATINAHGSYALSVIYEEEIFDGALWQKTGQIQKIEERLFRIS